MSPRCLGQTSVFQNLCSSQPPGPLLTCFPAKLNFPLLPRPVSSRYLAPTLPPVWIFTFRLPHQNPTCLSESCLHAPSSKKGDPSTKRGSTLPWLSFSRWCLQRACILLMSASAPTPLLRGNLLESKEYVSRVWLWKALDTVPCTSKVLVNHWPMRIFKLLIWNHWFSPS